MIKICAFDDKSHELNEIVSSALDMQIVRMPGHYWHGFKALGNEPALLLYFTTNLYNPADPDEQRRAWNDPTLIPKIINGRNDDPRVGKPWDWNYPPHKWWIMKLLVTGGLGFIGSNFCRHVLAKYPDYELINVD